jgi:hypothetical protein
VFFLLVVIDGLSVLQDSSYSLDVRDEGYKAMPEFLNMNDIEEEKELCPLWQTTPV